MNGLSSLRTPLTDGLRALSIDSAPPDIDRLLAYLALIDRWNKVYNLTAVRDPVRMVTHHLLDSLSVLPALDRRMPPANGTDVLDVGSGPGLPGLVIALMRADLQVTCVDAVAKKASFIRQAAAELGLPNLHVEHARVESLQHRPFRLVTARAFASLADFTRWTEPLLADDGMWMAMKARRPEAEIAALPSGVEVIEVEPVQVPGWDAERCLVWMRRRR